MTGRILKRNILEIRGVSQSVLQNHPPPDLVEDIVDSSSDSSIPYGTSTPISINWSSDQDKSDDSLWSGKHKDLTICEGSWSEATGRTISSCSWGDDDFEKETTSKVQEMLESIDEMLYEGSKPSEVSPELYQDCQEWARRFPYLRLSGVQLVEPVDDSVVFYPTVSQKSVIESVDHVCSMLPESLCLEGKEMTIYSLPTRKLIDQDDKDVGRGSQYIEEILAESEGYEELLAYDDSDTSSDLLKKMTNEPSSSHTISSSELEVLKEKVIDKLMEIVWPEVVNFWQAFEDSQEYDKRVLDSREGRLLPPLSIPLELDQQRSLSQFRPRSSHSVRKTAVPGSADMSNLEGILTVSSKVLQSRKDLKSSAESSISTRPRSSLIALSRASVSSHSPIPSSSQHSPSKPTVQIVGSTSIPGSRATSATRHRGGHGPTLHMPVVEEDSSSLPNILAPELDQPLSLDGNMSILSQVSGRHVRASFLPPINDPEMTAKNKQNIKSPPPPLQSSCSVFEKNQANVFGRYLTVSDSRPSTSKSFRGLTGHASLSQKSPSPVHRDLRPLPVVNHKGITPSPQKIVTLFPLVTPLDPGRYIGEQDRVRSWRNFRRGGQSGTYNSKIITRR